MRNYHTPRLFFALFLLKEFLLGMAETKHVRGRRGIKGSTLQRTILLESHIENSSSARDDRGLEDELPCTHYYSTKKSKFNKYDDDWYDPCKTSESKDEDETESPTVGPSSRSSPTRTPSMTSSTTSSPSPESDPPLTIVTERVDIKPQRPIGEPSIAPTISPSSIDPLLAPSKDSSVTEETTVEVYVSEETTVDVAMSEETPVDVAVSEETPADVTVSEETTVAVQVDKDVTFKEKGISCLQAKSGRVAPTSVNFTIHYKYELLAKREANSTGVVWPEVDRAFQRFLALTLIDCDIDVGDNGASPTFRSRLKSISPEPRDSVGSLYPNGWKRNASVDSNLNSCTRIVIDNDLLAKRGLYCDVITGSITLYLSEVSYMDTAGDPSISFLEYRDEIFKFLRDEINDGGEAISNYFDDSLGIRGFYFISDDTNLNLRPISTNPDAASNELNPFGSNKEMGYSSTAVLVSMVTLISFTVLAGVFAIFRKKKRLYDLERAFKQSRTPRMDDSDVEFYDLDISNHGSTDDALLNSPNGLPKKMFFQPQGNDLNHSVESDEDFDAIYDLNEKNSHHSRILDYSQLGVSMRSRTPDGTLSVNNSTPHPHPSMQRTLPVKGMSSPDPDLGHNEYPEDEFSNPMQKYDDPRSPSEDSVSSSTSVDSEELKVSPALEYILALGSSVRSLPNKPFDEVSVSENQNDALSIQESAPTQCEPTSPSSEISKRLIQSVVSPDTSGNTKNPLRSIGNLLFNKRNNRKSVTNWSILKPRPSLSSFEKDDGISIASPPSSSSESSSGDRRQELETRFQNYRSSLSQSIDSLSDSPYVSRLGSREFEEILDNDHCWGIESPEMDDEDKHDDNFLASENSKETSETMQFQADTVML